ncbi:hypothetical protein GCM10009639_62660 [Kitasatospora putterlickiae]|uniref:Uncharacterized protein n=1 Tax=Kitasatospora putterlickiae TaxID=221725 RepID=A0ABN1YG03_9ACTN
MTERTAGSPSRLRGGTQELLERRGMATTPDTFPPRLRTTTARSAAGAGTTGAVPFRHGGRDAETAVPHTAPARHAELKGHRHRGAEKHSAH